MKELEVLFADGRSWWPPRKINTVNLFYGFPNSYGTLGYALRVKIALVPVKPFVKLTHHGFQTWILLSGYGTAEQRRVRGLR